MATRAHHAPSRLLVRTHRMQLHGPAASICRYDEHWRRKAPRHVGRHCGLAGLQVSMARLSPAQAVTDAAGGCCRRGEKEIATFRGPGAFRSFLLRHFHVSWGHVVFSTCGESIMFASACGVFRRLTGRCPACGAKDWRALNNGWTLPEPVCGKCSHVASRYFLSGQDNAAAACETASLARLTPPANHQEN